MVPKGSSPENRNGIRKFPTPPVPGESPLFERNHLMTPPSISETELDGEDRAASSVEYSLLVALITVAISAIAVTVGTDLQAVFQNAAGFIP
jgi:Flp pilus assembly pilin Flp